MAAAMSGDALECGRLVEVGEAGAVGEGGGVAPAEEARADGEVEFVDEAGGDEREVEGAAAFAEEPADAPLLVEPVEGGGEIEGGVAAGVDVAGEGGEACEAGGGCLVGDEEDDGREGVAEDLGPRVEGGRTGGDDAEIVFGEAALPSESAEAGRARSEVHGLEVGGAGAAEDGVGGGAEGEEVLVVARAAEGGELPVGGGDFAIGGHGHIDEDERAWGRGGSGHRRIMASP